MGVLVGGVSLALVWLGQLILGGERSSTKDLSRVFPMTVRVIATDPSGAYAQGLFFDFTIDPLKLQSMAKLVLAGATFTYGSLSGPHRSMSRHEFEVTRDQFVAKGLAYWRSEAHNQGVCLTLAGRAVIRKLAELPINQRLTSPAHARDIPEFLSHRLVRAHARGEAREGGESTPE